VASEISFSLALTAACDWDPLGAFRDSDFARGIQPLEDMERLIQLGAHSLDPHEFIDTVLICD
jgi:hypothetical protein